MQVFYLGRAPCTKETLPDFLKWRRITRPPLVFRGLMGRQRTPGFGASQAFNNKVQEFLREKHGGTIPFDSLTYGDLRGTIKNEGLKLCSQLKLQYQFKKDLKASKKDLGSFCTQYDISMPTPPSQIIKKQKPYRKTPFKNKKFNRKRKNLIKNLKNFTNQMNKNLIKKKLDVLSVVKKVI